MPAPPAPLAPLARPAPGDDTPLAPGDDTPLAPGDDTPLAPGDGGPPRIAGARELLDLSAGDIAYCGRALDTFVLAQLAALSEDAKGRGAPRAFAGEGPRGRPWQTFAALVAGAPRRGAAAPVVVTLGAKAALAAALLGLADLARGAASCAGASVEGLAELPWREACLARLLLACRAGAGHLLRSGPLSRDLDLATGLERRLGAAPARRRDYGCGSALAPLFLDFVRLLAWHAATLAWQRRERLTLNAPTLFGIIGTLEACHPLGAAAHEALGFLRERLECWERARPRPRPRLPRAPPPAEVAPAEGAPAEEAPVEVALPSEPPQ
jgi:hypothetical protein